MSIGDSNTVVRAYTLYRHLQQYCSHPSICARITEPSSLFCPITDRQTDFQFTTPTACCTQFFATQSRLLTTLIKTPFENIVGKGENAGNQHFLLFPQFFLTIHNRISFFKLHLFYRLQMLSIWTSSKMCRLKKS